MRFGAISKELDTIAQFIAFESFYDFDKSGIWQNSFYEKGKNDRRIRKL